MKFLYFFFFTEAEKGRKHYRICKNCKWDHVSAHCAKVRKYNRAKYVRTIRALMAMPGPCPVRSAL
jgi:hypothetical protein